MKTKPPNAATKTRGRMDTHRNVLPTARRSARSPETQNPAHASAKPKMATPPIMP